MTDKEFKNYVEYKTAESIKNTEARFEYLKRNIEINERIRKEKEDLLSYIRNRKPKIEQLKLFREESNYIADSRKMDYQWEWCKTHIVLREPVYTKYN